MLLHVLVVLDVIREYDTLVDDVRIMRSRDAAEQVCPD